MGFSVIDANGRVKVTGGVDTTGTPADNYIAVFTDSDTIEGTSALQFDGTTLTIPGQIAFPATQSASSGANTLDDYEEGTWTPVIGGSGGTSGQSYTTQNGFYQKIGKWVHVSFDVVLSNKGTITTLVEVQGLPFTAISTYGKTTATLQYAALGTNWVNVIGVVVAAATVFRIRGATAATVDNVTALVTADVTNTTNFVGQCDYQVSD